MNKTWFTLVTLMFLCLLNVCECETCGTIRARRVWKFVEEGGSLKLSCEVQHCGLSSWTGGWTFQGKQGTSFTPLNSTERISLSNSSAASSSHLIVSIHNVNQSDAGAYRCKVIWPQSIMSYGHVTYVNVTAVTESHLDSSGRSVAIKVLLCLGSLFLLLFVLGFVWCLTQNHQSPPPVPPRTSFLSTVKRKKELVYAEVLLRETTGHCSPKQASEPVVYASLKFSPATSLPIQALNLSNP